VRDFNAWISKNRPGNPGLFFNFALEPIPGKRFPTSGEEIDSQWAIAMTRRVGLGLPGLQKRALVMRMACISVQFQECYTILTKR
jgi:hypothetical protein